MTREKFLIIGLFAVIALFFARAHLPLSSTDSYFHLAVGRWVAKHHQIPKFDEFTFVAAGKEWISNEWLAGLILYQIYNQFGPMGILVLRVILATGAVFLIWQTLTILNVKKEIKITASLACAIAISLRLVDRPEMISFFLLALQFFLIEKYFQTSKLIYLLPQVPIFAAWTNIQGYTPVGLILFAYLLARKLITYTSGSLNRLPEAIIAHKKPLIVFLASMIVSIAPPGQFQRFFYVLFLNPDLFGVVTEVAPLPSRLAQIKYDFISHVPLEVYLYLALIPAGLLTLIKSSSRKKIALTLLDLLYFLVLMALGFRYFRTIPLAIYLTVPILATRIVSFPKIATLTLTTLFLSIIFITIINGRIPLYNANYLFVFDKNGQIVAAASHSWHKNQPADALAFIKANFAPQKILTTFNWSNMVIWELEGTRVAADIIYEKQSKESLEDFGKLSYGNQGWQDIVAKYDPDIIINTQPLLVNDFLEIPVWELDSWHLVYVDDVTVVYARERLIRNQNLILKAIKPQFASDLKFKEDEIEIAKADLEKLLKANFQNAFAHNQKILIAHKEQKYQEAQELTKEAILLFPKDPNFYFLQAVIMAHQNQCNQTLALLSRAQNLANGYYLLKRQIQDLAQNCGISL